MITGRQYLYEVRAQGIELHPSLADELAYTSFQPADQIYNVFAKLPSTLLDKEKHPPISAKFEIPGDFALDTPARLFSDSLNSTLKPVPEDTPTFVGLEGSPIVACTDAEARFTRTIHALGNLTSRGSVVSNGSQIITWQERPILLRKGHDELFNGESSALSLEPINIDGITYPSFSLFGISLDSRGDNRKFIDSKKVKVFTAEEIARLSFRRLSLFALKEKERRQIMFDIQDFSFIVRPQPVVVSAVYGAAQKLKTAQPVIS